MSRYLNPYTDFGFKKLFGEEANKDLLADFLNQLLPAKHQKANGIKMCLLGNRSAIEWVLDQYKEKTPKDATIAEKFNTYRFADYKEHVIDLICRVCKVSVETVRIVQTLANLSPLK